MSKEASTEKASQKYFFSDKVLISWRHGDKQVYDLLVSLEAKIELLKELRANFDLRHILRKYEAEYQKLIEQHKL